MPFPKVNKNHCYECQSPDVRYASLYPLEPIQGIGSGKINKGEGHEDLLPMKTNIDFNVCAPCAIKQFERRYPGQGVPETILMGIELEAVHAKYGI
jgi:hypothetical protein